MFWRFRGSPYYLAKHARLLGVPSELAHASRHNAEIFRIATLMSQLCEHWHLARKGDGKPVFPECELTRLKLTIVRCEDEARKLHVLAAAADDMLREAREAFGFDPLATEVITHDPRILPLGDGTVGVRDDGLEPALN